MSHARTIAAVVVIAALAPCIVSGGAAASVPSRTATVAAAAAKPAHTHPYVVRAGDGGWFQIAHSQGVPMQQLLAANHATPGTRVLAGQKINVPGAAKAKAKGTAKHA